MSAVTWVVCSTEEHARQKAQAWGVSRWTADYNEVLARDDVDIVDILLPHDLHAEVACRALARGKHVVLEKPLAPTPRRPGRSRTPRAGPTARS